MVEKVTILIDSHVHIYNCYEIRNFFRYTIKNFERAHNRLRLTKNFTGVLFFTETRGINYFKTFFENVDHYSNLTGLKFERTLEDNSLRVRLGSGNNILLIAGEQIITSENLEILALGTTEKLRERENLFSSIKIIQEKEAIPVIPWGVGKWFGKRGKIVKDIVQNNSGIFLGDNSGRPLFWPTPKLFRDGLKNKIYTLRGSDPLPIKSQVNKAGSFGFYFNFDIDLNKPFSDLKRMITNLDNKPANYGSLENPYRFFKNQFTIHFKQGRTK